LFKHLQNANAPLIRFLQEIRNQGIEEIYLAGSALENAGANIMGDLAAAVRMVWGPRPTLSIYALVLLEDGVGFDPSYRQTYISATAYELGWLTTPAPIVWRFPFQMGLGTFNSDLRPDARLLTSALLFEGTNGSGKRQTINFLWGVFISEEYRTQLFNQTIGRSQAVNLLKTYAVIWTTRYIRHTLAAKLEKRLLVDGRTLLSSINPVLSLDPLRNTGLMPMAEYLKKNRLANVSDTIMNMLMDEYRSCDSTVQYWDTYYRDEVGNRYDESQSLQDTQFNAQELGLPRHWNTWEPTEDELQEARRRIGWVVSSTRNLEIIVDNGTNKQPQLVTEVNFDQILATIRRVCELIVLNGHKNDIEQFLNTYRTNQYAEQRWLDRYQNWYDAFSNRFHGARGFQNHNYNLQVPWNNAGVNAQSFHARSDQQIDPTFISQNMLFAQLKFRDVWQQQPLNSVRGAISYPFALVALDLLEPQEIEEAPLSLLYTLEHIEAFSWLFKWWKQNALGNLDYLRQLVLSGDWERICWDFINSYEKIQARREEIQNELEEEYADLPPLPSGSPFANLLGKVFKALDSPQRPSYFKV
jgi:hypothetical protein